MARRKTSGADADDDIEVQPAASNSADIIKVLAEARPELERIDEEIAELNEQKKAIHKEIKEKTGMPQSCWKPFYKMRQLVDSDGIDGRERLAWMAMAAEAFKLCEPGGMVDMFAVGDVDPNPQAADGGDAGHAVH